MKWPPIPNKLKRKQTNEKFSLQNISTFNSEINNLHRQIIYTTWILIFKLFLTHILTQNGKPAKQLNEEKLQL